MSDPTIASLRSATMGHPEGLRVLIVRVGAMGDVLHAMPAVAGLRAALPGCFIGWAIEPRWRPLLSNDTGEMRLVDRVHAVNSHEWKRRLFSPTTARQIAELWRELRSERYDVCVDLQGSIKSAVIGRLAGVSRLVGADAPRERQARLFYAERVGVVEENVIDQACELISGGIGSVVEPARVALPLDEEAERWVQASFQDDRFVMLAPTAGWGAKEWGRRHYSELAASLKAAGHHVFVNLAAGTGTGVAEEIASESGATLVSSTLPQLIALTRRASLVIGGDTGPVHLAAALGRPVVALFGPTDPVRNGPAFSGARVQVLRHPSSVTDHRRHRETEAGLARIRVEEVLAAALAMLDND